MNQNNFKKNDPLVVGYTVHVAGPFEGGGSERGCVGGLVGRWLHTISAVRPDVLFRVVLTLYHSSVRVMRRTRVFRRALTQGVSVDLVHHLLSLAHREQPARFFALAPEPLQNEKTIPDYNNT